MCAELASATRSKVECISELKWVFDICFTGDFCQCSKDGGDSNQELEERCEAGGRVCSGHGTCDWEDPYSYLGLLLVESSYQSFII